MSKRICSGFLAGLLAAGAQWAVASETVLTLSGLTPGEHFENVTSEGVRFSPSCHVDVIEPGSSWGNPQTALGWDISGCLLGSSNPDYLGSPPGPDSDAATLYMDMFGAAFTLTSFMNSGMFATIVSSKGGEVHYPSGGLGAGVQVSLTGDAWTDVTWVEFRAACPGAPCTRLSELTFATVPTPGSLPLAALAIGALAFTSRPRRQGRNGAAPQLERQ